MSPAKKPLGKTVVHHKLIQRLLNGLPVADAKKEIVIHAIAADIKAAKRKDPLECVFAKACQRIFGSHNTAFFRNYAYVEKDNKIERFSLPKATRDSVMMFDKAGKAEPGGYLLRPPLPGDTLEARRERGARRGDRRWTYPTKKKRAKAPDVDFRSGTGLVQFLRAQKSWERGQAMTTQFQEGQEVEVMICAYGFTGGSPSQEEWIMAKIIRMAPDGGAIFNPVYEVQLHGSGTRAVVDTKHIRTIEALKVGFDEAGSMVIE